MIGLNRERSNRGRVASPRIRTGVITFERVNPNRRTVNLLAVHLKGGEPAVLPTETQYALAADATNPRAIARVRCIKQRPGDAPFSVFLNGVAMLRSWRILCPDDARALMERFWPGPLTLILPTNNPTSRLLGAKKGTIGVRASPEPIIVRLLQILERPILATSANPSGRILDPRAENRWLSRQASEGQLIWAKPARFVRRDPSTIIDCTGRRPRQLRAGVITEPQWLRVVGAAARRR